MDMKYRGNVPTNCVMQIQNRARCVMCCRIAKLWPKNAPLLQPLSLSTRQMSENQAGWRGCSQTDEHQMT